MFVFRVGGRVRLLKQWGVVRESAGTIDLWPDKVAKRNRPPLVLRLVVVQGARHPWSLVTSVRDSRRLSDRQVIDIYRKRWGLELFCRHFQQTFGRSTLRSHKAEHAECELHWSLLGLWTMLLDAQKHLPQPPDTPPPDTPPPRLRVARVLKAFGRALHEDQSPTTPGQSLNERLPAAVIDTDPRRDKRRRHDPRQKYEPPAKPPRITRATKCQCKLAKQLASYADKKRLPA